MTAGGAIVARFAAQDWHLTCVAAHYGAVKQNKYYLLITTASHAAKSQGSEEFVQE